jgi:hypothetical protein
VGKHANAYESLAAQACSRVVDERFYRQTMPSRLLGFLSDERFAIECCAYG